MVTDEVADYRNWIFKYWSKRVPRLISDPVRDSELGRGNEDQSSIGNRSETASDDESVEVGSIGESVQDEASVVSEESGGIRAKPFRDDDFPDLDRTVQNQKSRKARSSRQLG